MTEDNQRISADQPVDEALGDVLVSTLHHLAS